MNKRKGDAIGERLKGLTLVISTLERPSHLVRLLQFYRQQDFPGRILVGDAGGTETSAIIQAHITGIQEGLDIQYHHWPGAPLLQILGLTASMVETPYVAYMADRDFLIPDTLERCIEFLENHPDYVAANGIARDYEIIKRGCSDRMRILGSYTIRPKEHDKASERLYGYLANYTYHLNSLHRTEIWRSLWARPDEPADRFFAEELLPSTLSVVMGKTKHLDYLYLYHNRRDSELDNLNCHGLTWISKPEFSTSYRVFEDQIADSLSRIEGMSLEEARKIVISSFSLFLFRPEPILLMRIYTAIYKAGKHLPGARLIEQPIKKLVVPLLEANGYLILFLRQLKLLAYKPFTSVKDFFSRHRFLLRSVRKAVRRE